MSLPRLIYDDDCGFCTWCAAIADRYGEFELVGFSDLSAEERDRLPDAWEDCVHLVTDGDVYSCGKAVEQTIGRFGPVWRRVVQAVSRLPGYRNGREKLYAWGADHRDWWGKIVRKETP